MLKSLTITNFALIQQVSVEFSEGLNILSGETGAGKSILIDALGIILGERASADFIRTGTDFLRVEAVFAIEKLASVMELLDEQGIVPEEDSIIISRKVTRNGKNTIVLNGCHITLAVLRQIGEKLVDMHGQHENQSLLKPEIYISLLDLFQHDILPVLQSYREIYRNWLKAKEELARLEAHSREREQRLDMLSWQTKEISAAALRVNEDRELDNEIRVLANAERIARAVNHAYLLLGEGLGDQGGIIAQLTEVKRELESVERFDDNLRPAIAAITEALYQLEESTSDIGSYQDTIEFNPERLEMLQLRADLIYKLKKKYGATIEDILSYYEQAEKELYTISHYDEQIEKLVRQRDGLFAELQTAAAKLDRLRKQSGQELGKQITEHLAHLGMPKANFTVHIISNDRLGPTGANDVLFLFSANPGEEPKPLHKIISGGELSRIALAIKAVFSQKDEIPTLVFDEVDAGVGGEMAFRIAERISLISASKQVLCITHLPQIACMADVHIYIEKAVEEERTTTSLRLLTEEQRLIELARMVSGTEITPIALKNAQQILEIAKTKKEKWKKPEKS